MNLWNPMNVFSRPSAGEPVATFDPSRTGDPVTPSPGDPGIGYGETQVGGGSVTIGYRRHPIGFAPPCDAEPQTRYRTELSFRRHHELPSASTAPPSSAGDGSQPSWQTPASSAVGSDDPGIPEVEATQQAKDTPFYKREISFRRKREDTAVDSFEQDDASEQAEDSATADVVPAAEIVEHDLDVAATADASIEPAASDASADPSVPFYKREISFRRKKADEAAVGSETEQIGPDADPAYAPGASPAEPVVQAEATAEAGHPGLGEAADESRSEVVPADELPAETPRAGENEPAAVGFDGASDAAGESAVGAEAELSAPTGDTDVVAPPPLSEAPESDAVSDEAGEIGADEPTAGSDGVAAPTGRLGARKEKVARPKRAARLQRSNGGKGGKVVGLKIGASQIAAAVISRTDAGHELLELARTPLAEGIVVDGEVRDEAALSSAIKAFVDEQKLPRTDVRIGISSNRIGVRTLDIVAADDESRFDNAVRFKAHEVLPVALDESVLDYRVLSEHTNESGERVRRVLLVVAPRDQVEPYQRVADKAGIRLAGVDLEALALLRAFVEQTPDPGASQTATVVVSIGHESSTLLVAGGGTCEFTRVFDWGGGALEEAVAGALDVRPAEAATMLRHLSLSGPGRQYDGLDESLRGRATDAVRQRLNPFARELVNSLQFYQTQAESLGIGGIVITGGTSQLEGLDAVLHQMIGVPVAVGDPLARVIRAGSYDPAIEAAIGSMAIPIGLAIEDGAGRGVNLLPGGNAKRAGKRPALISVGAPIAVAVPLAALALLYMGAHGKVSDQQSQLDAVQAQIASLPEPTVPVIDAGVVGDEATRATAVANLLGGRVAWDGVFGDLGRVLPDNVWLTDLSVAEPDASTVAVAPAPGAATAVPSAVSIQGFTYSQPDVARLLARLATLPSLKTVTLTSSTIEPLGSRKVAHFTIVADLNQTGGAS